MINRADGLENFNLDSVDLPKKIKAEGVDASMVDQTVAAGYDLDAVIAFFKIFEKKILGATQ